MILTFQISSSVSTFKLTCLLSLNFENRILGLMAAPQKPLKARMCFGTPCIPIKIYSTVVSNASYKTIPRGAEGCIYFANTKR